MPEATQQDPVRVKVRIAAREFTYEAPAGTAVGDQVELPPFSYLPAGHGTMTGVVTALGSDYDGEVRPVLRVLAHETSPAETAGEAAYYASTRDPR